MSAALLAEIEQVEAENTALRERARRLREDLAMADRSTRTAGERDAFAAEAAKKCDALRREVAQLRKNLDAREAELDREWHASFGDRRRSPFDVLIQLVSGLFKAKP